MRKIIDGVVYDTETAERIEQWSREDGFDFYSEVLYRTPNGRYFIYCEVGPRTWTSGADIITADEDFAKEWLLENHFIDVYEDIFGPLPAA